MTIQFDALIIGGAVGGKDLCKKLAEAGKSILVADIDAIKCDNVATELSQAYGINARAYHVNVTDPKSVEEMFGDLAKSEISIDHLVSLAGGAHPEEWNGLSSCSVEAIERSVALNLLGHIHVLRSSFDLFTRKPGNSATLISSINYLGSWGLPVYSACKAGLEGLMMGCAKEFTEENGIRINTVLPGTIPTPRTRAQPKNFEILREHSLLKEFATAEEIADAVMFLAFQARHITQQSLVIDSGQSVYVPDFTT